MKGAKLSEIGEVLVDIFGGTGTVLAVIGALPTDVPASVELVIMIEVCRVAISKKQISALPKDERVLLLLMRHALNQISVFLKLFYLLLK